MIRTAFAAATLACFSACTAVLPRVPHATGDRSSIAIPDQTGEKQGASHEAGAKVFVVRGHYGVPILQKSIFWDGNGEVDNFGLGGYVYAFMVDGVAIGGGINGTAFKTNGHDEFGLEVEAAARIYALEVDFASLFIDITAGWLQTTGQVPEGGTEWNSTFSFGPGVDIPIGESTSLQVAGIYHHMSNALGRDNDRNPSQNEARFWVGVGWDF